MLSHSEVPVQSLHAADTLDAFFAQLAGAPQRALLLDYDGTLAPFRAERLGKQELAGYQASSRGGIVRVRARGDRFDLIGRAVTVLRGRLAEAGRFGPGSLTACFGSEPAGSRKKAPAADE